MSSMVLARRRLRCRCGMALPLMVALVTAVLIVVAALVAQWRTSSAGTNPFLAMKLEYELESALETAFNTLKDRPMSEWVDVSPIQSEHTAQQSGVVITVQARSVPEGVRLLATARGPDVALQRHAVARFVPASVAMGDDTTVPIGTWEMATLPDPS